MKTICEPARETPVVHECDLCVVGGSCTGVFAAVRAARLGLSVALVEQNIILGGMAAAAQVNEWHSLYDISGKRQIIGGLTVEVLDALKSRNAIRELERPDRGPFVLFNSAELALELDQLIRSNGIRLFLKSSCVAGLRSGNRISAAIIEDKSGRRAIRSRVFIDASGDGDLLRRSGFPAWRNKTLQPVSYQMLAAGLAPREDSCGASIWEQVQHLAQEFSYPPEYPAPWINAAAAPADVQNVYGPRLNGVDASDADQLTEAILESRRCHRALIDMVRSKSGAEAAVVSLAHGMGIRETWHANCRHRLTARELLSGTCFPDSIGRGTYPVDVHSPEGTLLRYLDGREKFKGKDGSEKWRRWRSEDEPKTDSYHIPYRCLLPKDAENLLVAGRLLDADREAFGGVRVMVNMNQTGEAAGVAASIALRNDIAVAQVAADQLRLALAEGGSLLF